MRGLSNRRRAQFTAESRCVQCGAPLGAAIGLYCIEHILKTAAWRWLKNVNQWTALRDLFAQQHGLCAYTGEPLTLGGNASIDHKLPRSLGGADELGNLQWVTWTVNRTKSDLTHEQFVAMCFRVAERWPVAALPQQLPNLILERVPSVQVVIRGEVA